jgi:hypothetical protein
MPYPGSTYEQQWREARDNAPFILVPVHSGHTPGPWHANGCCIEAPGDEGPRDVTIAVVHGQRLDANARLIAAAPELLAALNGVLYWAECECESIERDTPLHDEAPMCEFCVAKAAIAKAEERER